MGRSAKVLKLVQPHLLGTVLCRDILVVGPTDYVLRGFFLNTTSQKHHMDLWSVVMPLHRPRDSLALTYGNIIDGPDNARVKVDDVQRAAEVVAQCVRNEVGPLRALQGPPQFLRHIARMSGNESDVVQLDLALMHFLVGNIADALRILRSQVGRPESDPVHQQLIRQAFDALEAGPAVLQQLIDSWRDANVAQFGLEPTLRKSSSLRLVRPS